jgi:hypothetical protein
LLFEVGWLWNSKKREEVCQKEKTPLQWRFAYYFDATFAAGFQT